MNYCAKVIFTLLNLDVSLQTGLNCFFCVLASNSNPHVHCDKIVLKNNILTN